MPGVDNSSTQAAGPSTAAFNGGQTYQNEVYLEGLPLTSAGTEGDTRYLAFAVSVDAVDQFQVETNGAKAQYQGQGVENYVIKSGTNAFHGAAFEYFRNTDLDARGFFPAIRPVERQNEYGGLIGGPIKKNKIFFFTNYDGYRYDSGLNPTLQSIPTTGERTGDFSALPAPLYDPASQTCAGAVCTRTPFAGNIIPSTRISPISQSLQSYLPAPTNANIQNNYLPSLPILVNTYNMTGKVDAFLSDRHRLSGFFANGHYATNFTGSLSQTGVGVLPEPYTQGRIVEEAVKMAQLHDTFTIRPTLLNQFSYSYNRIWIPLQNPTTSGDYPQKAGIKGLPQSVVDDTFPDITFSGGTNAPGNWQGTNAHFYNEAANTFTAQDNIMWVKGKHSLIFGTQFQALQDNENFALVAAFTFANTQTAGYNAAGTLQASQGNAYASYLLGALSSSAINQNAIGETGGRYKDWAAYVQDDWKVSSRLTLNLGLRWDYMGPFYEVNNLMSYFNPNLANAAAGAIRARWSLSAAAPTVAIAELPSPVTTRTSALAWERRTVWTTRPSCGRAMRLCTCTPAGWAGVTTRARGSASSGTRPRTMQPALATTLRRFTGITVFPPLRRRRRSWIPLTGPVSSPRTPRAHRIPPTATR